MKTALALLLLITPFVWANDPSSKSSKRAASAKAALTCPNCGHAPCRCGFSPSYYTQYRKPLRRIPTGKPSVMPTRVRPKSTVPSTSRASNVVPGTSRASNVVPRTSRASNVVPSPSLTPSLGSRSRSGRVLPAVTPKQRLGYVPRSSASSSPSPRGRRAGISRTTNRPLRSTTLVPSPRRPKAVPSVTPRQKLGYDPSRSWSNRRRR